MIVQMRASDSMDYTNPYLDIDITGVRKGAEDWQIFFKQLSNCIEALKEKYCTDKIYLQSIKNEPDNSSFHAYFKVFKV